MSGAESVWYKDLSTLRAIVDFAINSGLIIKPSADLRDTTAAVAIGLCVIPSYFPRELFSLGCDIQPALNLMIDAISRDHSFLATALEKVLETDPFTKKLFDIYNQVRHDNKQVCVLGIHRCDYMLDWQETDGLALRQVEMNTIAAGMSGLSSRVKRFHQFVCSRYARKESLSIPDNQCLSSSVDAIAAAWKEYENENACVMFVVQPDERNLFDQRLLEFDLWQRHSIKCIRRTLNDIFHEATLGSDRELIISGLQCVVAYFRAGYTPLDYPTEKEWKARLLIEQSTATSCPSVAYQLAGTKKIQQCLAEPGTLEKFLMDSKMAERIRSTFAGLYSLDRTPEGDRAVEMALGDPEKFVLKPQREGGGNNFYDSALSAKLDEIRNTPEREAYILMDRLLPPTQESLILRPPVWELDPVSVVNELGIYGTFVRRGDDVILNRSAGHVLRTKPSSVNEGGVVLGVASLDCPALLATEEFISRVIHQS